ncbi:hypothetical protein MMC17_007436 [Xylographa soralifera]|nr:hypothetical protein [Xylographa soralifera]
MANTDTPSAHNRVSLLGQSRKDEQSRFMVTLGWLAITILFGSFLALIYSEEHKWMADNLHTLVLAVNNSTNIQDIAFNYTRVIDDTAMGSLLTELLPYVKKTEVEYCSASVIDLTITNIVVLFFGWAEVILTEIWEITRYQGARRSPYSRRAVLTSFLSSLGFATGYLVSLLAANANNTTLHGWDYIVMCFLGGASGATLGAFVGQAFPEKGDDDISSRYSFEMDKLFFGGTILWITVSIILGIVLSKSMAAPETAFIVALQELRGLIDSKSLYEDIISPTAWATLQSDVLPYVSRDGIMIDLSTTNKVVSLIGFVLAFLSLVCFLHTIFYRLSSGRFGLKIIPKKRNLSILISLAAGLVVAVALVAVFFVLVNPLEESSWYHRKDYFYTSFAITGLVGAAIPCRRGEDAVQISDREAAGPAIELRTFPLQATAVINPEVTIAPVQKNTTTIQVLDLGYGAGSSSNFGTEVNSRSGSLSGSTLDYSDVLSLDGISVVSFSTRLERGMAELADQE